MYVFIFVNIAPFAFVALLTNVYLSAMKENLKIITILFNLYQTSYCMQYIPLEIDKHPCQPKNLKVCVLGVSKSLIHRTVILEYFNIK